MGQQFGGGRRELSDGSYWSTSNITKLCACDCPLPDGLLKIDLRIHHQTYQSIVSSHGEAGNPRCYQEIEKCDITLELPGNMNRNNYYSAFHKWLYSLHLDFPLDPDMLWDFTFQVITFVFGRVDHHLDHEKVLTLCVSADLHCVPLPIENDDEDHDYPVMNEDDEPMVDEDEEYDPVMDEDEPMVVEDEEYDPVEEDDDAVEEEEYDPVEDDVVEEDDGDESLMIKPWVQELTYLHAVFAAEEHRKLGDCLICLDPLFSVVVDEEQDQGKKYLFASPCGHYFHDECMSKWLTRSDSCPLCRFDFLSLIQ